VLRFFESRYGALADTDGDGFKESYYYDTEARTRLWVTAALANAMVVRGLELRQMYRAPFFKQHKGEPKLMHAPYPAVMVKKAEFNPDKKTLLFTLVKGAAKPAKNASLTCANIKSVKSVTRDGKPFKAYKLKAGKLTLTATVDKETAFVVTMK